VLYPGSIERTSIAEAEEEKGFMIVEVSSGDAGVRVEWQFRKLPARPLIVHELNVEAVPGHALESRVRTLVAEAPADAVLTIRVLGTMTEPTARLLSAAYLRRLAPATMNIEIRMATGGGAGSSWRANGGDDALELWSGPSDT
jgi:DNA repair exonuclease SbcCD nuclease subunit